MDVDTKATLRALATIPRRFTELSRGRDERVLNARPSAEEWSAFEILAHVRSNADVLSASIDRMLNEDHPTIRWVSPRSAMRNPEYADRGFTESLDLFVAARKALLKTLKALPPGGWSRGARITARTKGQQSSVYSYAQNIVIHEAAHVVQFEALFN